jgi:hypothetical protein
MEKNPEWHGEAETPELHSIRNRWMAGVSFRFRFLYVMAYSGWGVLQGVIGGLFLLFCTGFLFWCHICFPSRSSFWVLDPVFLGWPFPVLAIALRCFAFFVLHCSVFTCTV